jgi:hypothetical protein
MPFKSQKSQIAMLVFTAVIYSKVFFLSLNDPEGSNLIVTTGLTSIIFFISSIPYICNHSMSNLKKFIFALFIQTALIFNLIYLLA